MIRVNLVTARSHYRKNNNVYYFHNSEYHLITDYTYENMFGVVVSFRSGHSFLFKTQEIKQQQNIKSLKYYIYENN